MSAVQDFLRLSINCHIIVVAAPLLLDLLHQVALLRCRSGNVAGEEGAGEVLDGKGVAEEATELAVEDVVLGIAVVAEKFGVELAAVLLRHPIDAIEVTC